MKKKLLANPEKKRAAKKDAVDKKKLIKEVQADEPGTPEKQKKRKPKAAAAAAASPPSPPKRACGNKTDPFISADGQIEESVRAAAAAAPRGTGANPAGLQRSFEARYSAAIRGSMA